jgi:hypothetical protein
MELILTSFGLSHLPPKRLNDPDTFYRMPPVSMSVLNQSFLLDFSALLLCESIILDAESFERLSSVKSESPYRKAANIVLALHNEGFVRVEDFDSIVKNNQQLLENMLVHDLKKLDVWVQPLRESVQAWQELYSAVRDAVWRDTDVERKNMLNVMPGKNENERRQAYDRMLMYMHVIGAPVQIVAFDYQLLKESLSSSTKRRKTEYRDVLRRELAKYLAYVNSNLVISNTLQTGFYDWYDIRPFYREKFLTIGREETFGQKKIDKVKQLFEVSFPEFTFWDAKDIIKTLKDKRLYDLRQLVEKAAKQEIEFDGNFANRVLQEVIGIEQRLGHIRKIISYLTLPIDFVPWIGTLLQKGTEELISYIAEKKLKREYRWFYLISEVTKKSQKS